ncbi:MAG: DUF2026 family protein [Sneathiella sp.]|nr:DUF2026 family protein [Sneathiella sp.]
MQILTERKAFADLAEICVKWFKKSPRKMSKAVTIGDDRGNQNTLVPIGNKICGQW